MTSQFYNLKDSMSLMTDKPHKHSFAHTEQERRVFVCVCVISQEDISQVAVIVRRW